MQHARVLVHAAISSSRSNPRLSGSDATDTAAIPEDTAVRIVGIEPADPTEQP